MAKSTDNPSDRNGELGLEHDFHAPLETLNRNGLTPDEVAEGGAHLDVDLSELRWNNSRR